MDACSIRPWVIGGGALAIVLFLLWGVRSSHRDVIGKYAKQWGVDAATAAAVRARRESRLSGLLIWLAFSPVFVMGIGVLAYAIGEMVPAFRTCTTPFSFLSTSAAILTGLVYCLPLTIAAVALVIFLTPPRLIAYRRALFRLRREDLPELPTLADFEAALPPLAPESPRTRLVSLAVCAAGIAVMVWLTVNHAPEVISDFITGHDRASPRMVSFNHGLTTTFRWFPYIVLPIALAQMLVVGWTILFGNSRALRKLAAKWSLSSAEMRQLFKPRYRILYQAVSGLAPLGLLVMMVSAVIMLMGPPAWRMSICPWLPIGVLAALAGLIIQMVCFAHGLSHSRAVANALQERNPAEGVSAADVAAGIDMKSVAKSARSLRLMGLLLVVVLGLLAVDLARTPGMPILLSHILAPR